MKVKVSLKTLLNSILGGAKTSLVPIIFALSCLEKEEEYNLRYFVLLATLFMKAAHISHAFPPNQIFITLLCI